MKVYFMQNNGFFKGSVIYDLPRESDTLNYLIRQAVRRSCEEIGATDAVITSIQDTVYGDILVKFETFDY